MVKLKKLKEADLLKIESESRSSSKSKIKEKINLKVQSISSFWVGIFVKVTRWAKNIREKQFSYIKVDIFNLDEEYRLIMDIPGIKDEALNIEMSPDRIVVSCNRDDSESATYQERVTGKAKRTIWFDEKVDPETCEEDYLV
jgi:HSP20 family molecular chaperone IbpA